MTGSKDPRPTAPNPNVVLDQPGPPSLTLKTALTTPLITGTPSRPILAVLRGPDVGRVLTLPAGQVITVGRAEDCMHRFDDAGLSRTHARVMNIGGQLVIADAGSTNGTFVNDQRIDKPHPLRSGDRVQLGTALTLTFLLVDEAEEASMRAAYESAMRDALTGVFNRKHLEERLDAEVAFANRHSTHLSLVILDVDFFKKVNDTHGHPAGDAVLSALGRLVQQSIRSEDVVARYGGEEFVVVLRNVDRIGAWQLAERLRLAVASQVVTFHQTEIHLTISAGAADLSECTPSTKQALLSLADGRLYQAKQSGRNRVL